MKARLFYLLICSIVMGVVAHICIILLVPLLGEKDAARKILASVPTGKFEKLADIKDIEILNSDPFFEIATCKFDISDVGVEVEGERTDLFWSASIFNARGRVLYSFNNRTAIGKKLKLILVNPIQMASIRQRQPEELETSIVVETSENVGFIAVRVLVKDTSLTQRANNFLHKLRCSDYTGQV
ncbi:MAG: hypothetical protein AAF423_04870 [Pseudomonadota bacterium]